MSSEFIKECAHSEIRDPTCPVFKINQILKLAEPDENEQKIMLLKVEIKFFYKIQQKYSRKSKHYLTIEGNNCFDKDIVGM